MADYTQKTQELSAEKKAFEEAQQAFQKQAAETAQLRETYSSQINDLAQVLQADIGSEPNWQEEYQRLDAKDYTELVRQWNAKKENLAKVQAEKARLQEEQARITLRVSKLTSKTKKRQCCQRYLSGQMPRSGCGAWRVDKLRQGAFRVY